ncbi:MAG: hypothetical protein KGL94_13040 [Acidobacteriota bacterium]|nr:hypothetical protein [Acidobacteriota bacterium]
MTPVEERIANARETASAASEPAPLLVERSRLSTAETAECRCPDFCERDHDRD